MKKNTDMGTSGLYTYISNSQLFVDNAYTKALVLPSIIAYTDTEPQTPEDKELDITEHFPSLYTPAPLATSLSTTCFYGAEKFIAIKPKKLVIADRAVSIVTYIPEHFGKYQGSVFIFAGIVYAIQLYADFSGGVDMCRGVAEIYGITMAENFRRPYFSKTLTEYWHRWHITLGDWLRNYLFYPISLSKPFLKMGKNLKKVNKNFGKVLL